MRLVLDWITRQSWSDGRVGMYGDRYSGNHSLGNAVNLGTLASPARSLALRDLSTNGFFDNGTNPRLVQFLRRFRS